MVPTNDADAIDRTRATPVSAPSFGAGRYAVRSVLGEGGQKTVYLVRDTTLERDCALSLLKTDLLDPDDHLRIRREAQAMASLAPHPNLVTVYDIAAEQGRPYIVCEYVPGGDLYQELRKADGDLPFERALAIARDIARALAFAHRGGLVHRDIKPGNVWLTEDGDAKLGDFGLAVAPGGARLTQAGFILGTPAYMAPEQALGSEPDARSDLYSFGCILYELLTGRPPFLADDALTVISNHINVPPPPPSALRRDIPPPLERLTLALLSKRVDERPASADEALEALEAITGELTGARASADSAAVLSPLYRLAGTPLFGRQEELAALKAYFDAAAAGSGRLCLIAGEPGIGKTRLAQELGIYAQVRGGRVLTGRCYESQTLPYLPFVEAIGQYVRDRPDDALLGEMAEGAPEIAQLLPELRQRLPAITQAPGLQPEAERYRLFESVSSFLSNASREAPVVVFLDDLHWADKDSLLLLQHLAARLGSERLLVIGMYREVELDRAHPLADSLPALRRTPNFQRILLRGLAQEDVQGLIEAVAEDDAPATVVDAIVRETEGNPFFVVEVLRHLIEEGKAGGDQGPGVIDVSRAQQLGIPESVREVIGRRLTRLSDGCSRLLTQASALPGGASWEVLAAVGGESEDRLLDLLDEALAAQLIRERTGNGAASYEFTHALVRQTLYAELSTPRKVRLHRQIGQALEGLYAENAQPHLAELAYHFFQAAPAGEVEKAIEYARRAGERATGLLGYDEAAGHFERALQALELKEPLDEALQCELLLALGGAQKRAGDVTRARETFRRAAGGARALGAGERLAEAAIAFAGVMVAGVDEELITLLEEALAAIGEQSSAVRARLLGCLGVALYYGEFSERREALTRQAVDMAREIRDVGTLGYVLQARHAALWTPDNLEERLVIASEMARLVEERPDMEAAGQAALWWRYWRLLDLLELGDLAAADEEIAAYEQLAGELRQALFQWNALVFRAMRALFDGRLEEAEQLVEQVGDRGQRLTPNAAQVSAVQSFALRREQGRIDEQEAPIKALAEQYPNVAGWRATLALLYAELGREQDARTVFDDLAGNDFAGLPRDIDWLATTALLAETGALLGDGERADVLYELLIPYADRNVVIGAGAACVGSTSYYLALLASTTSRWGDAEQHFTHALERNAAMGARPFLARTQLAFARMLLERGGAGDRERASSLLAEAVATAELLELVGLGRRAVALIGELS